jgi:ATP-binding cassette subfamily B protein
VKTEINLVKEAKATKLISRLWLHLSIKRRKQFFVLLVLMILVSFTEVLSLGALLPFLTILTNPARVFENPVAQPLIYFMGLETPEQLILPLTLFFCISVVLVMIMRLVLLWATMRLSYAAGADISNRIYRNTLYQPYATQISQNSSKVITGILIKANGVISCVITPLLTLISSTFVLTVILAALFLIDPLITLLSFAGFSLIYSIISRITHKRILQNGNHIAHQSNQITKNLQEGLGAIRDVLIRGSQNIYCQQYSAADLRLRQAQSENAFMIGSPRYIMEALGILLIVFLAYLLLRHAAGFSDRTIPVLGALAMGAQRMLPALQQAYSAISSIKGEQSSLQDTLDLLDQPLPTYANDPEILHIPFRNQIALNGIYFRYSNYDEWILNGISLIIKKGTQIGFVGTTGCGKSTLLDVIMGLLQPSSGTLEIDGVSLTLENNRNWQAQIAHVPQSIFMADCSIEENIAFGVPKDQINQEKVRFAAQQAQIAVEIEAMPRKYQTIVGERGVQLSGGQRQRIGIARALYVEAKVIVFDEATSALDFETEQSVINAVENVSKELTFLIIAHRLSTLKNCSQIVELSDGKISRVGSYAELAIQEEYA